MNEPNVDFSLVLAIILVAGLALGWLAGWLAGLAGWLAGQPGSIRIQEEANVDIFKVLATFLKIE